MRRSRDDEDFREPRERGEPTAENGRLDVMDAVDMLGRRIGGAIVLAGILIGFGLYAGSGDGDEAGEYQMVAADGEVFRLNTDSGTVIACNASRCTRVLVSGQELADDDGKTALFQSPPGAQAPAAQRIQVPTVQLPPAGAPQAPAR